MATESSRFPTENLQDEMSMRAPSAAASGVHQGVSVGIPEAGYAAEPYGENEGEGIQAFVADDEVVEALDVELILTEEEEELIAAQKQRKVIVTVICVIILIAVIVIPVAITQSDDGGSDTRAPTISPTQFPSASPSETPTELGIVPVSDCLEFLTSKETFGMRGSGQWKALNWIVYDDLFVTEQGWECDEKRWVTRYVLAAIYFTMGGENWQSCGQEDPDCLLNRDQFGWLSNHDVCEWHQIRCNNTDVMGINFGSQFPNERALTLFEGEFPSEIRYLTDLAQINLKEAGTQGKVSDFFSALSNLEEFNLQNNQMTGPLPEFFTGENFPVLRTILFSGNQFSGTIPSAHGSMNSLREYRFADNKLSGRIPPELGNMELIAYIDLANNELTGPVPPNILTRTELRVLSLPGNEISGTLPSDINKLSHLQRLRLQSTRFSGIIPPAIYDIEFLLEINVGSTRISGVVDPRILNAKYLQIFNIDRTEIGGEIPDVFGNVTYLEELRIDFTKLVGTLSCAVCEARGTDFGEIEILVYGCSIETCSDPEIDCGECVAED